jgi:hypothetical protein
MKGRMDMMAKDRSTEKFDGIHPELPGGMPRCWNAGRFGTGQPTGHFAVLFKVFRIREGLYSNLISDIVLSSGSNYQYHQGRYNQWRKRILSPKFWQWLELC